MDEDFVGEDDEDEVWMPFHTYPEGGSVEEREDLSHDFKVKKNERVTWTTSSKISDCICCKNGVCVQKIIEDPLMYHVPVIIHGIIIH